MTGFDFFGWTVSSPLYARAMLLPIHPSADSTVDSVLAIVTSGSTHLGIHCICPIQWFQFLCI
jgi:hypothetical protein